MRKVEARISIRKHSSRVITAFTDYGQLHDWWQVERCLIETKTGGLYTLAWDISPAGFGYVSTGLIKAYDPNSHLIIENMVYLNPDRPLLGPMTLTIKATAQVENTELYLCQEGYQQGPDWDWYYEAVVHAWPEVLMTLKKYIEGLS